MPIYISRQEKTEKESLEENYKEQPEIAIDGTEHTVRTTDNKTLRRKLLSTPLEF